MRRIGVRRGARASAAPGAVGARASAALGADAHAEGSAPLLAFSAVGLSCSEGARTRTLLRDVSFELHAGAAMGIYGGRRSGKSSLLRLAAGLQEPERGSVRFEGRELRALSGERRARLLRGPIALLCAIEWQPCAGETVMDHVAMSAGSAGLSLREARRRALEALDRAGVAGVSAQEMGPALSPAERACVSLARALVREPRLLIVDEPAPLPSLLERERFCALLRAVARERGIALLVASEELSALQGLGVLASLSAGELCATGGGGAVLEFPRRVAGIGDDRERWWR